MTTGVTLFALGVWVLTGVFFGLMGSIYGAVRSAFRIRGWLGDGTDLILTAGAGAVTFLVLVGTDWGVLRIWTVAAIVAGYLFWTVTAGDMTYRLARRVLAVPARLVRGGLKTLGYLVRSADRASRWAGRWIRRSRRK